MQWCNLGTVKCQLARLQPKHASAPVANNNARSRRLALADQSRVTLGVVPSSPLPPASWAAAAANTVTGSSRWAGQSASTMSARSASAAGFSETIASSASKMMIPGPPALGALGVAGYSVTLWRRPRASGGATRRTKSTSLASKPLAAADRCRHSTPRQRPPATSATRISSPSPRGASTSRERALAPRSRSGRLA